MFKDFIIAFFIFIAGVQTALIFSNKTSEIPEPETETKCVISHENVMWAEYRNLSSIVMDEANKQAINPSVIFAIIKQESMWDPNIVSPKGAIGLMQIMPATGKSFCDLSEKELYDPQKNVKCGMSYLVMLSKKFNNDLELVLCGYNAGPNRVIKLGRCPNFTETNKYKKNILKVLGKPKKLQKPQLNMSVN